jgi:hypothetical protein
MAMPSSTVPKFHGYLLLTRDPPYVVLAIASGHRVIRYHLGTRELTVSRRMTALGHSRPGRSKPHMSALPPEADNEVEVSVCLLCAKSGQMHCSKRILFGRLDPSLKTSGFMRVLRT